MNTAPESTEPSRLERRYRLVLRMLPRWYREDRAEEMTATFLAERTDRVDLEYSWPAWREAGSVAALAVRTRLAVDRGPARALAWGHAIRLTALLGLLGYAGTFLGWHAITAAESAGDGFHLSGWLGVTAVDPLWPAVLGLASGTLITVSFAVLVLGHRAAAIWAGGIGVAGFLIARLAQVAVGAGPWAILAQAELLLLVCVPVACLALGFHREAPPVTDGRRWLAAAGALALVTAAEVYAGGHSWLPAGADVRPWAAVAGVGAVLLSPRLAGVRRSPGWMTALAIGAALLAAAGLENVYYALQIVNAHDPVGGTVLAVMSTQTAAVSVAAIAAAVAAARVMRTLPAHQPAGSIVDGP